MVGPHLETPSSDLRPGSFFMVFFFFSGSFCVHRTRFGCRCATPYFLNFFLFFGARWLGGKWKNDHRKQSEKKKKKIKKCRKSSDLGGTRPLTYSARRRVGHDGQKRKKMKKKAMKKEKREREWKVRGTGEMRRRSNYGAPPSPAKGTPHKKKNILEKKKGGKETFQRLFLSAFRLQKKRKKEKETKSHRRKGWGFEIHARLISFRAGGNEKKNVPKRSRKSLSGNRSLFQLGNNFKKMICFNARLASDEVEQHKTR